MSAREIADELQATIAAGFPIGLITAWGAPLSRPEDQLELHGARADGEVLVLSLFMGAPGDAVEIHLVVSSPEELSLAAGTILILTASSVRLGPVAIVGVGTSGRGPAVVLRRRERP